MGRMADVATHDARTRDDGFTLIETIVALGIAMVLFTALAAASIAGIRGVVVARSNYQAEDVANAVLESARTTSYTGLAMVSSDLSSDSRISAAGVVTIPGVGSETVVTRTGGAINPHVATVTRNNVVYTVSTYVTQPATAQVDGDGMPYVKRVTAWVTWTAYGSAHSRIVSTIVANTIRGLPLPDYTMTLRSPSCYSFNVASTSKPVVSFTVRNLGARDSFSLSSTMTGDASSNWTFYSSDPTSGAGTAITDTNSDGKLDTGIVEAYQTKTFWFQRNSALTVGSTVTFAVRAQSESQPSASSAVVTLPPTGANPSVFSVTSQSGNVSTCGTSGSGGGGGAGDITCPASPSAVAPATYAPVAFGLNNGDTTIDGSTQAPSASTAMLGSTTANNVMVRGNCQLQAGTPDFSTNLTVTGFTVGRTLRPGGAVSGGGADSAIQWALASGTSSFTVAPAGGAFALWYQCTSSGTVTFQASLGAVRANGNTDQIAATAAAGTSVSCGTAGNWYLANIPLTASVGSATTIANSGLYRGMTLRVWTVTGSPTIRAGYDFPVAGVNTNKSFVSLAVK